VDPQGSETTIRTYDPLHIDDGIAVAVVQPEDAGKNVASIDANRDYLRKWLP
jgi:hypothetical protein